MKNQYFGDFGDYQKISLLETLQREGLQVLVYWMKTKDDESTDGKHISYLEKPELWRSFAPEIYDFLKAKVASESRDLMHIEQSKHCAGMQFLNTYIEDETDRNTNIAAIAESNADVVFFDPDNGIEVASTNKKNIHKYVTWPEIVHSYASGKSVIIYQHFSRTNREKFIRDKTAEISKRIGCRVISIQVQHSVYFILVQKQHEKGLQKAVDSFASTWGSLAVVR